MKRPEPDNLEHKLEPVPGGAGYWHVDLVATQKTAPAGEMMAGKPPYQSRDLLVDGLTGREAARFIKLATKGGLVRRICK